MVDIAYSPIIMQLLEKAFFAPEVKVLLQGEPFENRIK